MNAISVEQPMFFFFFLEELNLTLAVHSHSFWNDDRKFRSFFKVMKYVVENKPMIHHFDESCSIFQYFVWSLCNLLEVSLFFKAGNIYWLIELKKMCVFYRRQYDRQHTIDWDERNRHSRRFDDSKKFLWWIIISRGRIDRYRQCQLLRNNKKSNTSILHNILVNIWLQMLQGKRDKKREKNKKVFICWRKIVNVEWRSPESWAKTRPLFVKYGCEIFFKTLDTRSSKW